MKILIAIDSFKGSMSSLEAGNAAKVGILQKYPNAEVVVSALADGGEGTYSTLLEALGGVRVTEEVHDPLGRLIKASYGILADGRTAVIEMAESSGITLIDSKDRNPCISNTYGFGEIFLKAYDRGCREFIVGIGGSATTEAGIGMLGALGFKFMDSEGKELPLTIDAMDKISYIDDCNVDYNILDAKIHLACDVNNPLLGESGAVYVYGPQKGVDKLLLKEFDCKLRRFSEICEQYSECKYGRKMLFSQKPGAGAAGGLGFAFLNFFSNLDMRSGADIVIDYLAIEKELNNVDIVITGEGRLDGQTASGKGPMKLALLGKKYGCKVFAFSGCFGPGVEKCDAFFDGYYKITPDEMALVEAMKKNKAVQNMIDAVGRVRFDECL